MKKQPSFNSPRWTKQVAPLAWALLSQSIWLPVLIIDFQDRLASKNKDYEFLAEIPHQELSKAIADNLGSKITSSPGVNIATQQIGSLRTGILLNAVAPESDRQVRSQTANLSLVEANPSPIAFSAGMPPQSAAIAFLSKSSSSSKDHYLGRDLHPKIHSQDPISAMYSRSEMLGGVITLQDLHEPVMPPIARAERAQWARSGDPLAPIPQIWRESMRKALRDVSPLHFSKEDSTGQFSDSRINSARVVHVPSLKIRQAAEVPLALQADGTVDILTNPKDPAVVEEIKTWSTKQELPSQGSLTPAVVHLHPLSPARDERARGEHQQVIHQQQGGLPPVSEEQPPVTERQPSPQSSSPEPSPASPSAPAPSEVSLGQEGALTPHEVTP